MKRTSPALPLERTAEPQDTVSDDVGSAGARGSACCEVRRLVTKAVLAISVRLQSATEEHVTDCI